jgi:hypothetical protein
MCLNEVVAIDLKEVAATYLNEEAIAVGNWMK